MVVGHRVFLVFNRLVGDGSGSSNTIIQILAMLAKSYFPMKRRKDQNMRNWGEAVTNQNAAENDTGFINHANNPIKHLLFLGMKPNEVMKEVPNDMLG